MKFRKLFATAKKIELKLALAQETLQETIISNDSAENDLPENDLFFWEPKSWSPSKITDFKKMINAWGKTQNYSGNITNEDSTWAERDKAMVHGLRQNDAFPKADMSSLDRIYDYFKAKSLLAQVAGTFGLSDAAGNKMSEDSVVKVQEWLKNMNRYSGPTDGKWNSSSQAALADLQKAHNVPSPTGDVLDQASQDAIGLDMTIK